MQEEAGGCRSPGKARLMLLQFPASSCITPLPARSSILCPVSCRWMLNCVNGRTQDTGSANAGSGRDRERDDAGRGRWAAGSPGPPRLMLRQFPASSCITPLPARSSILCPMSCRWILNCVNGRSGTQDLRTQDRAGTGSVMMQEEAGWTAGTQDRPACRPCSFPHDPALPRSRPDPPSSVLCPAVGC